MNGEKNLDVLLSSMSPVMHDGVFVFCSFKSAQYGEHATLEPVASIMEAEGLTLVIPEAKAIENHISYDAVFRCITLQVHSSLEAVGLTAAFAQKLTEKSISANVIAGFYHDHIFVQQDYADKALSALQEFSV